MLKSLDLRVDTANLQREAKYKTEVIRTLTNAVVLRYRGLYFVMPRTAEDITLDELGNLRRAWGISRYKLIANVLAAFASVLGGLQGRGKS